MYIKALFCVHCAYSLLITVYKHAHPSLCHLALFCFVSVGNRMKVLVLKEPRESETGADPYIEVGGPLGFGDPPPLHI